MSRAEEELVLQSFATKLLLPGPFPAETPLPFMQKNLPGQKPLTDDRNVPRRPQLRHGKADCLPSPLTPQTSRRPPKWGWSVTFAGHPAPAGGDRAPDSNSFPSPPTLLALGAVPACGLTCLSQFS